MTSNFLITIEEAVDLVKQILPTKQLNTVKLIVFRQAWLGKGYSAIAGDNGYDNDYIRMVGAQLWQSLSEVLGEEVTKKNFQFLLTKYAQNHLLHTATGAEFPGSPIPLNSRFYIQRPSLENQAYAELRKPGSLLQVKAPQKMGKSTFLLRIIQQGIELGYHTVCLDFQQIDREVLSNLNFFLRWFCINITHHLGIESKIEQFWNEDLGSKVSCSLYLRQYLLEELKTPLILVLTEINQIFEYPNLVQDFLPLLRSWHEEGKHRKSFQKLRLVMAYSAEFTVCSKIYQSPFNVGLTIELPEFTLEEIQKLIQAYNLNFPDISLTQKLINLVGGHPYLIQLALYHFANYNQESPGNDDFYLYLEKFLKEASTPRGIYGEHLRRYLARLENNAELLGCLEKIINSETGIKLNPTVAYKLESLGVVKIEGEKAKIRCELYRSYFTRFLKSETEPSLL